jgi:GNAT superfamily N-acetyltransferase
VLDRSLCWVTAHTEFELVAFINVAWDGGEHAFLLDTTVHPDFRRQGIGTRPVAGGVRVCRERGITWVHVDCVPELEEFYRRACAFRPSAAGILKLS